MMKAYCGAWTKFAFRMNATRSQKDDDGMTNVFAQMQDESKEKKLIFSIIIIGVFEYISKHTSHIASFAYSGTHCQFDMHTTNFYSLRITLCVRWQYSSVITKIFFVKWLRWCRRSTSDTHQMTWRRYFKQFVHIKSNAIRAWQKATQNNNNNIIRMKCVIWNKYIYENECEYVITTIIILIVKTIRGHNVYQTKTPRKWLLL